MSRPGEPRPEEELEELLFACLEELEERGESALEALLARHPAQAAALRARLGTLAGSGLIGARGGRGTGDVPERLGDFQVLERLGEGGMGVVYRARQLSLGREVALKLIRPDQLYFGGSRERFRREVETVAGLHHPGIVAVHTVGEEQGVPYFAMELVRGQSVEQRLTALSARPLASLTGRDLDPAGLGQSYLFAGTWEEACLRVVRQACEALHYAHERGVLHRDLKPSNLMLSSEGAGRALLLDFGLARGLEADPLTRTGSQLGSLRYMAPEQLRGEVAAVGPRTDLYGLGVTLYEMLTLAPAFSGTQAEVAVAVSRGALEPLRRRNPDLSWEAETLCAAATDPDPARRYASAADMARDLTNALEKRPIEARRAGAWLRLRRWVERHPAAALAVGLALVLVVGGPTIYAWQQQRARLALAVQRDRAEQAYGSAMVAIDRMLGRVGSRDLAYIPAMEALRERLLGDAVELLEELESQAGADASTRGRLELAGAHHRLAQLLSLLGRSEDAAAAAGRGRQLLAELAAAAPLDLDLAARQARATVEEARHLARAGDLARARVLHEELEASLGERLAHGPEPRLAAIAANNRAVLGVTLSKLGEPERALELLRAAALELDQVAHRERHPDEISDAFWAWSHLGQVHLARGEQAVGPEALAALERAVELARLLVEADGRPSDEHHLASALINLGGAQRRAQEYARSQETYRVAQGLLERLVGEHPSTLTFRLELATVLNQLGLLHDYQEQGEEAGGYYRRVAQQLEELWRVAPHEPLYGQRYAIALYNLSAVERSAGDLVEAEACIERGLGVLALVLERAPDNSEFRASLLELHSARWVLRSERADHRAVAEAADDMAAALASEPLAQHRAALALVRAFELAGEDPLADPEQREAQRAGYAARACAATRAAYALGAPYSDLRQVKNLAPLHGRPEFEELLAWFEGARRPPQGSPPAGE